MNKEIKAILAVIIDAIKTGKLILNHENFYKSIIPALSSMEKDIVSAISNWDDFKSEILAITPGSDQEKDLLAFIDSQYPGSPNSKKILDASLKLILDILSDLIMLKEALGKG